MTVTDSTKTKSRFLMLGLYSFAQMMNTIGWICFSPLVGKMLKAYPEATVFKLTFLSMIFLLMYIPVNPIAIWLIEKQGIRVSFITGLVIQTIGFWLRSLINVSFSFVILGQIMLSIGQPVIINMCTKLSANWFPKKERVVSSSTGMNFSMFGSSLGFLLPFAFVQATGEPSAQNLENTRQQIQNMLIFISSLETVLLIVSILIFKEKPGEVEQEPEHDEREALIDRQDGGSVASSTHSKQDEHLCVQLALMIHNRNYMLFLFSISLLISQSITFSTVLELLLAPYGYTGEDVSIFGFFYNFAGIFGGLLACIILFSNRGYFKTITSGVIFGTIITLGMLVYTIMDLNIKAGYSVAFAAVVLNGFLCVSAQAFGFEYAVDLAPDVGESMTSGSIMVLANILGLAQTFLIQGFFKGADRGLNDRHQSVKTSMIIFFVVLTVALALQAMVEMPRQEDPETLQKGENKRQSNGSLDKMERPAEEESLRFSKNDTSLASK